MSNLSTKNIKTDGEGGVSKTLEPGTNLCKINNVTLDEFKFKEGALNVMLHLEGEDLGKDFEGFFIDKNNESLGRHKGKVGVVKATEWAFADGETKSGVAVSRDKEMMKYLKQLCTSLDCLSWFDAQDEKHATIQSIYTAFNKEKPFGQTFFRFCIAGKEYTNRGGYKAHELFLPKYSKTGTPVEKDDVQISKLIKYSEAEHIRKKKEEKVEGFGDSKAGSDFEL
jgi:hypothetical protein